ncbi:uncharacterized protein LOC112568245 isoform X2 [Pomacea canaliculata]|uniref:uncharacterized protein LOC112568245 isoform X2 n=1 Tax=Pomacea canaliculata TaxID=400727 RepID=UPI000D7349D2|nr:uncharacterized protein LOC112568245 isoform X2 [Pomacea canaliculata]
MSTYIALALTLLRYLSVSALTPAPTDFGPGISIKQDEVFDPTILLITCGESYWGDDTLFNREISHIPDQPSGTSTPRQIAFSGRSSVTKLGVLNPDAAKPGVVVTSVLSPLTVSYVSGTCEDTGLYRCKEVYRPVNEGNYTMKVSEARVQACSPGAIATLESFVNATFVRTKLVCRVNTSLVFELLSLEISVVRQGNRHLLAYINSFLNDAKLSYVSKDVTAEGQIHPFHPAASSLNVTSDVTSFLDASEHTATCTAVYLARYGGARNVVSMADIKVWFQI